MKIFARGDEGTCGNILLIAWTTAYLLTCYFGSVVMTLGQSPTDILNDIGIMQLYGENATQLDTMVYSRKDPAVQFSTNFLYSNCHPPSQRLYRFAQCTNIVGMPNIAQSNITEMVVHVYLNIYRNSIRWVALILMFATALTAPDLIRFPFMLIFVLIMISPLGSGILPLFGDSQ